jgi:hypothetical protein
MLTSGHWLAMPFGGFRQKRLVRVATCAQEGTTSSIMAYSIFPPSRYNFIELQQE